MEVLAGLHAYGLRLGFGKLRLCARKFHLKFVVLIIPNYNSNQSHLVLIIPIYNSNQSY